MGLHKQSFIFGGTVPAVKVPIPCRKPSSVPLLLCGQDRYGPQSIWKALANHGTGERTLPPRSHVAGCHVNELLTRAELALQPGWLHWAMNQQPHEPCSGDGSRRKYTGYPEWVGCEPTATPHVG